jgi:transposase
MLSPGQDHDLTCADSLIEAVDPGALIADKAFDADAFIAALNNRAIVPVIPSKSNRKTPRPCDFALYCERNLIERFFNKLKHFRPSPRATTSSIRFSSPASSSPAPPSYSTEHRP